MNYKLWTAFSSQKQRIRNLAKVAFAQGNLDELDLVFLNNQISRLNLSKARISPDKSKVDQLRSRLPKDPFERFALIYDITKKLMVTSLMTDNKERALRGLASVFIKNRKTEELVQHLRKNICYGKSVEDSYSRLGYMLRSA